MRSSRGRISSSRPRPARSCSITRTSCSRTAIGGRRRSPPTSPPTRPIAERRRMILHTLAFYLFAAICIASGVMVVSARNPVHSVLFLILAFFNAAGLFVLMGAEFLAMILVIVYVGAVAVLFLFVVMMLDINFVELRKGVLQYLPVGLLVGFILAAELLFVIGAWVIGPDAASVRAAPMPADVTNTAALGRILYTQYLYL